jgi:predicted HTH transcriptional regulator
LIDDLSRQNFESAVLSIQAIRGFALLGKNLYEIEPKNYSLLENELEQLNTAIRQEYGIAESIDMRQFISTKLPIKKAQEKKEVVDSGEILVNENEIGNEFVTTEADYSMNERQDRIMSLIASQRKMQLRDFISAFPGVSERTLRYDLKRLFEQGRVVRQGSGGPGSFYVIKEN